MDLSEVVPGLYVASRLYRVDEDMISSVPVDVAAVLFDDDSDQTALIEMLSRAVVTLRQGGFSVTLFCHAGRNRSAVVAADVLIREGWEPQAAVDRVRDSRAFLAGGGLTNRTFVDYLERDKGVDSKQALERPTGP